MHILFSHFKKILSLWGGYSVVKRKLYSKKSTKFLFIDLDKTLILETLAPNAGIKDLPIIEISTYSDYLDYKQKLKKQYAAREELESKLAAASQKEENSFEFMGFDSLENEVVYYHVSYEHALKIKGKSVPNYRESTLSSISWLNSRMRSTLLSIDYLEKKFNINFAHSPTYLSEEITAFHKYFKAKYPKTVGSEYVSPETEPGTLVNGIRHEDVQNLSFDSNTFDLAVSMEVLEHVPNYISAFESFYRVLKDNGLFVFTVPFDKELVDHKIMAEVSPNGEIIHYQNPPEFHGDPMRPDEGALCYRYFGWKTMEELKSVGFKKVGALFMYSFYHGIIGNQDFIVLYAQK